MQSKGEEREDVGKGNPVPPLETLRKSAKLFEDNFSPICQKRHIAQGFLSLVREDRKQKPKPNDGSNLRNE